MTDEVEQPKAVALMMQALEWGYEHATAAILPGLESAVDLAESHLKSCGGDQEKAIDHLIARYMAYAGAVGFASNVGGFITVPVAVPVNVGSVFLIQLRMIAAIAHLRGYPVKDEQVKTLAFICLTGRSAATFLQEFGIGLGMKLTADLIMKISGATLIDINKAVGFRLVTKAGTKGLINLIKFVPFVGGLVGGGFDGAVARGIGAVAKKVFKPIYDDTSTDPAVMPEPVPLVPSEVGTLI
ncbi:MAG: EcsC family protein [Sciscionella sp.]